MPTTGTGSFPENPRKKEKSHFTDSADTGGEALLADAAQISRTCDPKTLADVQDRLWLADRTRDLRQPMLSVQRGLHVYRYRDDLTGRPRAGSPQAEDLLARLRQTAALPLRVRLEAGQGYLIHNHRILHGRTAFTGPRLGARLQASIDHRSSFSWLNKGFRPDTSYLFTERCPS